MDGPGWSDLHHGIDPATVPLVAGWLRFVRAIAGRLRWVPPTVLTVLGVLLVLAAIPLATVIPLVALGCVLAGALCDGLDGAVAVATGRFTRTGAVADAVADRIADVAFAVVIWRCGAPWWLAGLAGVLSLVHELVRVFVVRARRVLTMDERPTRVVCASLALICAASTSASWPATVCAAVWAVLAVIGLAQLAPSNVGTVRFRA